MTGPSTGFRYYDDEEFLEAISLFLDFDTEDDGVGTASIAMFIGCDMLTANRRLFELADESNLEVYDDNRDGDGPVDLDTYESAPKRQLVYRRASTGEADS